MLKKTILINTLLLAINSAWADVKLNCNIYQDGKLLTTQEKTLTHQQLNSLWANNNPEKFANNYFKQSLCKSVGLAQDRKPADASIRGIKYHKVTVYKNKTTSPSCKVRCLRADNNPSTQSPAQINTLDNHEKNIGTLSAATGYITAITAK